MTEAEESALEHVRDLEAGSTAAAALDFFDSLPPVQVEDVLGSWHGSEVPTGNPLDGLLGAFGWHGKRFDGVDEAHPLVMRHPSGRLFSLNPAFVPAPLLVRRVELLRDPRIAGALRRIAPALRTRSPRARLRSTVHRGVATATMCYDALPIHDAFRQVSADTLLGAMDLRGLPAPFLFVLRRESATD
ncbi:DUF4334 domain-containing protein [Saccharopolyspora sp. HNM0983]|uniref:DUF4334 domain-containing protein n=1 Tax=Saccharopolyspora montiporae TaxID=2781240 RepID=A0A929B9Z5_9PSEU|nr:DUF4334 domain-containing protein [Saccharopolyspora sp. HNM0983]MBE9376019.1 DUF4334 domain-containing protein [Saccharopolyspora sp. HNM0983]